jgi:hypothetical protein
MPRLKDEVLRDAAKKVFKARDLAQEALDLLHSVYMDANVRARLELKSREGIREARTSAALLVKYLDDDGPCDELCENL